MEFTTCAALLDRGLAPTLDDEVATALVDAAAQHGELARIARPRAATVASSGCPGGDGPRAGGTTRRGAQPRRARRALSDVREGRQVKIVRQAPRRALRPARLR